MSSREQRVRMLAYRIWESEGRPDGQEERHWMMAERIVAAENAREDEQEWQPAHDDEAPVLEGEELPLEDDEKGIDEQRLPLDAPEVEALKEEDTGVEVHPQPAKPRPRKTGTETARASRPRKTTASKEPGAGSQPTAEKTEKKPAARPRKPRNPGPKSE